MIAIFGNFFLLVALQKTPSLLGAECRGVGTTPLHANERGQTVRFVAVIEPPVYWGISMLVFALRLVFFFPLLFHQFDFDGGFCDRFHNLSKQCLK